MTFSNILHQIAGAIVHVKGFENEMKSIESRYLSGTIYFDREQSQVKKNRWLKIGVCTIKPFFAKIIFLSFSLFHTNPLSVLSALGLSPLLFILNFWL